MIVSVILLSFVLMFVRLSDSAIDQT